MDDAELRGIADAAKELANRCAPQVVFVPKYGGEVMVPEADDPKTFVGGLFLYKDHVSVEFSNGAGFDDPDDHLEGKGKARRHLKLRAMPAIEGKSLEYFLRQAFA